MSSKFLPSIIEVAPENLARLIFGNGVSIETGKEFGWHQIKTKPEVSWDAEPDELYTVLLVEAVAMSNKTETQPQICHWMVVNIPGNNVYQGQMLIEYKPPTRFINDRRLHRLIFLVFKQADIITAENFVFKITTQERIIVKANDSTTKYTLGHPVAGNYYKVRND